MGLNAIGAYGFLAKAHIGHAVAGETAVAGRAADIEARLSVQAGIVADIDRRLSQIDSVVSAATQRGRTNAALSAIESQRQARKALTDERSKAASTLPPCRSRRPPSTASGRWPRQTWARSGISPRCSALAIRMCCAGSSSSWRCCSIRPPCCSCWQPRRPGADSPRSGVALFSVRRRLSFPQRETRLCPSADGLGAKLAFRATQSVKVACCASFCKVHICSVFPLLSLWTCWGCHPSYFAHSIQFLR